MRSGWGNATVLLLVILITCLVGCTKRSPASLPPVIVGVPTDPADEFPIAKTDQGFVKLAPTGTSDTNSTSTSSGVVYTGFSN